MKYVLLRGPQPIDAVPDVRWIHAETSEGVDAVVYTDAEAFAADREWMHDRRPRFYAPAELSYLRALRGFPSESASYPATRVHDLEARAIALSHRVYTRSVEQARQLSDWYPHSRSKLRPLSELGGDLQVPASPLHSEVYDGRRLRVLVVNDYRVDSPSGGGQLRVRGLYGGLSSDMDVTLLCMSDAPERREIMLGPCFRQIAIPKTSEHRDLQQRVDARWSVSAADVVSLLHCGRNAELVNEFRAQSARADIVAFEHPYLAALAELVPPLCPVVYSSHNVETQLKATLLKGHPFEHHLLEAAAAAEESLIKTSSAVIVTSAVDQKHFAIGTNAPVFVVANGADPPRVPHVRTFHEDGGRPVAIFIGSIHKPNIEAGLFITNELAPSMPEMRFVIIGSVCAALATGVIPDNVELAGVVDHTLKLERIAGADFGINPMVSGGGSSLKIAEYLAHSLPVVTTPLGARGYNVADKVHLRVAGLGDFASVLRELAGDVAQCEALALAGRDYAVANLSWTKLSAVFGECLRKVAGVA